MDVGYFLPNIGELGSRDNVAAVARRAEELGYSSLWVTERLLYPLDPQTSYFGGPLPEPYKHSLDPLATLTFVAGITERIRLGTSILDIPFYNPAMLARALTALDVLSNGRLHVGLGLGWSKDEHDAAGAEMSQRGRKATEFIKVLKAIWTEDPVEFEGQFFRVPKSTILPKPAQKPRPPITLAAFAPGALKRAATVADGWHPVGLGPGAVGKMMEQVRGYAREAGRDPAELQLIVRANINITDSPVGEKRQPYTGTLEQVRADLDAVKALGPTELIIDTTFSDDNASMDRFMARMEQVREMAG